MCSKACDVVVVNSCFSMQLIYYNNQKIILYCILDGYEHKFLGDTIDELGMPTENVRSHPLHGSERQDRCSSGQRSLV